MARRVTENCLNLRKIFLTLAVVSFFNVRPCFCEIQFTALSNMYKIRKRSLKDKMEHQDEEHKK